MTEIGVEIKTEPLDDEGDIFNEEELIIKSEIDIEENSFDPTPVPNSITMNFQDYYAKVVPKRPLSPSTFQCHECKRFFVSESSLFNHKCLGKQSREYKQACENERKLLKHKRLHCSKCNRKFQTRTEVYDHKCKKADCTNSKDDDKRLRGRTMHKCTICGQTFRTLFIFEEHMQYHRNKLKRSPVKARKPMCIVPKSLLDPKVMVFACNLCDISFSTAKGLQNHNMVHGGIEYICKKCGKSFTSAIRLKTHTIGDTCTKESVADFLGSCGSESSVDIKAEAESEDDVPMESLGKSCKADAAKRTDKTFGEKCVAVHDKQHTLIPEGGNFAATVPQLTPMYSSQDQDVPLQAQRNALTLSNKLSHLRPPFAPQRLDVIIDGLGNAFVLKKEDLITGALQYPQIQKFHNEQVVVDAQGNAFKFSQKPQQDAFFIAQDHCYTRSYPPAVEVKAEPAELEMEPPSDPINYEDVFVEQSAELTIKEEPAAEIEIECPSDPMNYEDLLIEELFDRKAKSMAKVRKAVMDKAKVRVPPKVDGAVAFEDTDFVEAISPNCLEISEVNDLTATVKDEPSDDFVARESNTDCALEMDPQCADDFEEMIDSATAPHLVVKCEIIDDMRDEYQKAKKKNLGDSSADESSHQSSEGAPLSIFVTLTESRKFYNGAYRKLDKRYRYIWICAKCPKQYIQRNSFFKHQMTAHYKDSAELKTELFELRPELLAENIAVEGYCHLCRVTLADAVTLQKHRKEIHAEDENASKMQFRCHICGKFCSSRSTLGDHVHSDCGKNPQYGCEVCGKKFYSRSTLQLHKTMHTGELPFKCTYCDKRVRTRGQLTVHTRTHTGERPFPCKVCERRFTHRETLISHLSRHIDMKRYKCNGCQALFASISGLKTHRENRIQTCGKFKFNSRPIGPRVRVIKGNVIFEPQPKFNPYSREYNNVSDGDTLETTEAEEPDDNNYTEENASPLDNIGQVAETQSNSDVTDS